MLRVYEPPLKLLAVVVFVTAFVVVELPLPAVK
jgi:hypothetical protein